MLLEPGHSISTSLDLSTTLKLWQAFVANVPASLPTFPIWFNDEEMHELKGSMLEQSLAIERKELSDDFNTLKGHYPSLFAHFDLQEWFWARCIVNSRQFLLTQQEHAYFVPVADLLNHATDPNSSWDYSAAADSLVIMTTKMIPAGNSIKLSYGDKDNASLFLRYGFALESNPNNTACFQVAFDHAHNPPPADTPQSAAFKCALLGPEWKLELRSVNLHKEVTDKAAKAYFSFARAAFATPQEMSQVCTDLRVPVKVSMSVSLSIFLSVFPPVLEYIHAWHGKAAGCTSDSSPFPHRLPHRLRVDSYCGS